jgi:hypothetical protein
MPDIKLTLTIEQAKALLQISQNQLFRLKFLDPKMPGYKARPGELENAESAAAVLERAISGSKVKDDGGWQTPHKLTIVHHET